MKAGELKKIARAFGDFLPPPWKRIGNKYLRREGDWVQMVVFYPSRWNDDYIPRSCFEFLKDPDEPTGTYLGQELVGTRHKAPRWITVKETSRSMSAIFDEMARQFKPAILAALKVTEIRRLLEARMDYWPHAYALCVMAAEAGDKAKAEHYFAAYEAQGLDPTWDSVIETRKQLKRCIKEAGTEALSRRLAKIQAEKLRALKLTP
ncbi:MAG: hypothetical protein JWR26_479 [Pedosphaera sp.]|nr:hypothetical protein [Pedosphaera sp.]